MAQFSAKLSLGMIAQSAIFSCKNVEQRKQNFFKWKPFMILALNMLIFKNLAQS